MAGRKKVSKKKLNKRTNRRATNSRRRVAVEMDSLVEEVVADPDHPGRATMLQGLVGASCEDDCIRVYLDPSMSRFVDVPNDAVLAARRLSPEVSPLGGSILWVSDDSEVSFGGFEPTTPGPFSTLAIGEEGPGPTTLAVGEEGSGPTTFAVGEEGPGPTTFAVGECQFSP